MSSTEESPAQRAARLRRERREAKIKEGGAARLDKITSLSGRTPQKQSEDASPSPSLQPPTVIPSPSPSPEPRIAPRPTASTQSSLFPQNFEEATPEMLREQQEALRALLRQPDRSSPSEDAEEDPSLKLLNALMGGMPGAPGAAGQGAGGITPGEGGIGGLSPELLSSLGVPSWISSMLGAATSTQTEEQKKAIVTWKILHMIFAVAVGIYLIVLTGSSISTYGSQPPPPATVQNPFLFFTTGELVLSGARIMMKSWNGGQSGPVLWIQLVRDVIRDGSIVLFLFGMGAWWNRDWVAS